MKKKIANYHIGRTIGSGTFGKVKLGIHIETRVEVAIKVLQKSRIKSKKDLKRVRLQIQILMQINHVNLIKLLELHETEKQYFLITELAEGKQLYKYINEKTYLDEDEVGTYFIQLLSAVQHLHSKGICHRDIKPENIIVQNETLKLIDFGLGTFYQQDQRLKTSCGSACYAAPQMLFQTSYNPQKSDVWAMGITLYAMLSGKLPFNELADENNATCLYKKINKNAEYEAIQNISTSLAHLLQGMIESNPTLRLSLQEISQHVWVKSYIKSYHLNQESEGNKLNDTLLDQNRKISHQIKQIESPCEIHHGAVHLAFLFHGLQPLKEYVQQHYAEVIWINQYEAKYTKLKDQKNNGENIEQRSVNFIKIQQIQMHSMYYLHHL